LEEIVNSEYDLSNKDKQKLKNEVIKKLSITEIEGCIKNF
jgi:hypothetical protein